MDFQIRNTRLAAGMAQLVASLYYRAAKNAGERGKDPLAAERAFAACEPSAKHLAAMELYGPMGLFQATALIYNCS